MSAMDWHPSAAPGGWRPRPCQNSKSPVFRVPLYPSRRAARPIQSILAGRLLHWPAPAHVFTQPRSQAAVPRAARPAIESASETCRTRYHTSSAIAELTYSQFHQRHTFTSDAWAEGRNRCSIAMLLHNASSYRLRRIPTNALTRRCL